MVPLITVKDMTRAVSFYTRRLGAKLLYRARGSMKNDFATLKVGGVEVWFIRPEKWEKRTLSYHTLVVKNLKRFVSELQRAGVRFDKAVAMGPESKVEGPIAWEAWGGSAFFKDSEGNLLMAWQNTGGM